MLQFYYVFRTFLIPEKNDRIYLYFFQCKKKKMSPIWQMITFLAQHQRNHPFRTSAIWRGRGSNFIEICLQEVIKQLNGRGGSGQKVRKICERPKWMVPKSLTHFFESVQPKAKVVWSFTYLPITVRWGGCCKQKLGEGTHCIQFDKKVYSPVKFTMSGSVNEGLIH